MDLALVLRLVASIEQESEHPIADAIVRAAKERDLALPAATEVESTPGGGMVGTVEGRHLRVGRPSFVAAEEDPRVTDVVAGMKDKALTPVVVAIDKEPVAVYAVSDPIRKDVRAALERLRRSGIAVHMVTGDHRTAAMAVGSTLGFTDSEVVAEVQPQDKLAIVERLKREGHTVGMVGDGVNDAPALAYADVGFAIGSGTDVAMATAPITLIHGDLSKVADAIELSRRTMRTIKENLLWAFGYNTLGIPIAALGLLSSLGGPMLAAAAMALSSVSVVTNSLRLRRA
jgi:Cu+-exporting ATPase